MSTLLVQGCSKSKNQATEPVPALELYSGFFFKIIGKAIRSGEFVDDIDISILSAEHGLIDGETLITHYDRRMEPVRARELRGEVSDALSERVDGDIDRVVLNLGKTYRLAVSEFARETTVPVKMISGGGIGEKGHALKQFVRGDDGVLQEFQPASSAVKN